MFLSSMSTVMKSIVSERLEPSTLSSPMSRMLNLPWLSRASYEALFSADFLAASISVSPFEFHAV